MAEEDYFRNELATLLEYSKILKIKRPPKAEVEVQHVLSTEQNIIARINQIKEIDSRYQAEPVPEELPLPEDMLSVINPEPTLKKPSWFTYLVSFRKFLLRLCHENSVLIPKFLGFKFYVSDEALALLDEIRANTCQTILPILTQILEKGWKVLSPGVYNVFYTLYQFLNNFYQRYGANRKNLNKNFDFVESFSPNLLTLLSNKRYLQDIREGIYIFFSNKESDEMASFLLFIEGIMDRQKKFSLLNFVLMIYSAYYRQPITLDALLDAKPIDEIIESSYKTIPKAKNHLQKYLKTLRAKQKINDKKLFFLKHIYDEDPRFLEDFIQKNQNERFKLDFFTTDLLKSTEEFIRAFMNYGEPILTGEMEFEKSGKTEKGIVFKIVWQGFFTRLNSLLQEIAYQRETHKYLFISYSSYEQFHEQNKHLESEKDENFCILIDKSTHIFYDFFESMTEVLYHDFYLTYYEKKEDIFDKLKRRNFPISETESERFVPFSDYHIADYNNETVVDILTKLNAAAGTFLEILSFEKILDKMREKTSLMEVSKNNLEQLVRLSGS